VDELNTPLGQYPKRRRFVVPPLALRAVAGSLGFSGNAANTKVDNLSGGEKARLTLGLATMDGPHLLILDEPTNHLDIDSRAALIEAINGFSGAIILVSHDRHLLDACADRLWLVANGAVEPFDGDIDDYRRRVLRDRSDERPRKSEAKVAPAQAAKAPPAADLKTLRKRMEKAEAEMAKLSKAIETVDTQLADGTLFTSDPKKAAELSRKRQEQAQTLARIEEEWLAAGDALQSTTA